MGDCFSFFCLIKASADLPARISKGIWPILVFLICKVKSSHSTRPPCPLDAAGQLGGERFSVQPVFMQFQQSKNQSKPFLSLSPTGFFSRASVSSCITHRTATFRDWISLSNQKGARIQSSAPATWQVTSPSTQSKTPSQNISVLPKPPKRRDWIWPKNPEIFDFMIDKWKAI